MRARGGARCGVLLKSLGTGLHAYATEFSDWLPGVNTTGVSIRQWKDLFTIDVLRRPELPAQSYDWISPLLRYEMSDVGRNRAERFHLIQNHYRCPSQAPYESILYAGGGLPADKADFFAAGPWTALSYLMPAYFQYFGNDWGGTGKKAIGTFQKGGGTVPMYAETIGANPGESSAPRNWEVNSKRYLARLDQVGATGRKIAAADGTRYLDKSGTLDHDIAPHPAYFGSFTDSGAWWSGSTAYGVAKGTKTYDGKTVTYDQPGGGLNLSLSYRHGCTDRERLNKAAQSNAGLINALFFDGHVARLSDSQSREITYWYPSGSVVTASGATEGMTKVPAQFVIP